jgi:fatty-acyl-CoA synthase
MQLQERGGGSVDLSFVEGSREVPLKNETIGRAFDATAREIEEFLYRDAKVQAVQVCGIPDSKFGEEVCAWIQLRPGTNCTAEEIREFCQNQIAH